MINFLAFVGILHLMAILTPGPDIALITSNSIAHGRKSGVLTALGIVTGIFCFLLASTLGFTQLIYSNKILFQVIAYISGIFVIILGTKIIFPSYSQENSKNVERAKMHPYLQGLITNLLNPKALLYFLALFSRDDFKDHALWVAVVIFFVSLFGFTTLAMLLTIETFSNFFKKIIGKIEFVFGILMIIFGGQILFFAFTQK